MDLQTYLSLPDALSVTELRLRMIRHGYLVRSDTQIRQWQHKYKGRVPSPENCTGLEIATEGRVTRKDLRPDNWHRIWPEIK